MHARWRPTRRRSLPGEQLLPYNSGPALPQACADGCTCGGGPCTLGRSGPEAHAHRGPGQGPGGSLFYLVTLSTRIAFSCAGIAGPRRREDPLLSLRLLAVFRPCPPPMLTALLAFLVTWAHACRWRRMACSTPCCSGPPRAMASTRPASRWRLRGEVWALACACCCVYPFDFPLMAVAPVCPLQQAFKCLRRHFYPFSCPS